MRHQLRRRHAGRWLALAVVLALGAAPLLAAEIGTGDSVVVGANQVIEENFYAAADSVRIDGVVQGDVVAVGNTVTVNGTITGDLLAAASTVVINGQVADARVAGGVVQLGPRANLSGDLLAGTGTLDIQRGSFIGVDALFGAGQVLHDGTLNGDMTGAASRMLIRGAVGGSAELAVGGTDEQLVVGPFTQNGGVAVPQVPPGLTIDDAARIEGALRYRSTTAAAIGRGAQVGDVSATVTPATAAPRDVPAAATMAWGWLRHLAALAVIGLLLLWLRPAWLRQMGAQIEAAPLPSLGWGLVAAAAWILTMIVVLMAMIFIAVLAGALTLGRLVALTIGLGLLAHGLLTAGLLVYVGFVAQAIVALLAGRLLLARLAPAWNERPAIPLLLGLALYIALTALPWVGWLFGLAVGLLGLGALWEWAAPRLRRGRAMPLQPAIGPA